VRLDRLDTGIGLAQAWHVGQPEQAGHGRPVDVGVKQADLQALAGQRDGEIGGNGGLAHAALA
jgi:hypothetical protein